MNNFQRKWVEKDPKAQILFYQVNMLGNQSLSYPVNKKKNKKFIIVG